MANSPPQPQAAAARQQPYRLLFSRSCPLYHRDHLSWEFAAGKLAGHDHELTGCHHHDRAHYNMVLLCGQHGKSTFSCPAGVGDVALNLHKTAGRWGIAIDMAGDINQQKVMSVIGLGIGGQNFRLLSMTRPTTVTCRTSGPSNRRTG